MACDYNAARGTITDSKINYACVLSLQIGLGSVYIVLHVGIMKGGLVH